MQAALVRVSLAMAALAGLGSITMGAEDDAIATGHRLVAELCSGCHAVEATGESPLPEAPRFRDLHERYDVEMLSEALVEGIVTAHPEMPQFSFEPQQAEAIVAYLKSLE